MSKLIQQSLINHLSVIYPTQNHGILAEKIIAAFWPESETKEIKESPLPEKTIWSETTTVLITYGDTLVKKGEKPLKTLQHFLKTHLKNVISCVHILPFFPFSSDAGFSVMDYKTVRKNLGTWDDINAIGKDFRLMSDIVINHASARGNWFQGYLAGEEKYKDFFVTASPEDDLSLVIRPRPDPLLTAFNVKGELKYLWCTFGSDQIDLNFANPDVLIEFVKIMQLYLDNNVRIFRMDAVAFLWKEIGTACIHLPQTHEIIRLFRTLIDFYKEDVLIITETNVPNHENLAYFGNQNEAHLIYNFSLPPLLIQALLTGQEIYLKKWMMAMPPAQDGCAYLNFIAGHDGIGLRPTNGFLTNEALQEMIRTIRSFGGEISMRTGKNGQQKPYEMNIALYDAFKGTIRGKDNLQRERFLASQTIMMALGGVPAFYIHSLLATPNDYDRFKRGDYKRGINRHKWKIDLLNDKLKDPKSDQIFIFNELKRLIKIRAAQKCFHPNATQFTLHLPGGFFGVWRQSLDRKQNTFCITNLTDKDLKLPLHTLNLYSGVKWVDLLTEQSYKNHDQEVTFSPYQSMWITGRRS